MDLSKDLNIRNWILKNNEWFMGEIVFHRENQKLFNDKKIQVWRFDAPEGKGIIK
jgi:hypothetical protein